MPDTPSQSKALAKKKSSRALPFWAWISGALAIIVLDQITKVYFDQALQYGERWNVLPFFDFTLLYNPGAAFSFLADGQGWQRWFFTAIALGAIGLILHLLRRNPGQRLFCASLTFILGGAIGNVIDRIQHGHVIDFLLFYWDSWYFPAFNIADIAITCGAILLVLDEIRRMRREKRKSRSTG
ncbi:lipoprotein signal peptidase [Alcaligenaceae bacterium]|nr:lipoprotein signal peptidase [Alcaligenaceae bacterium]